MRGFLKHLGVEASLLAGSPGSPRASELELRSSSSLTSISYVSKPGRTVQILREIA